MAIKCIFQGIVGAVVLTGTLLYGSMHAIAAGSDPAGQSLIDELRLGIDAFVDGSAHKREDGAFVRAEVLFRPFSADFSHPLARIFFSPRPHLGAMVGLGGDTTSQVYGGLTWTFNVTDRVFVEGALGAAVHNGKLRRTHPGRPALGSRVLFHESAALGLRLSSHMNVIAFIDHASNASLYDDNDGLTHAGMLLGYRF